MKKILAVTIAVALAAPAFAVKYVPYSQVDESRAIGEDETVGFPGVIPASPFRDEGVDEVFATAGKTVNAYGFNLRRIGRGSSALYEKSGWLCLDDKQHRSFACYGKDQIDADRVWLLSTSYKGRFLNRDKSYRTFATLTQVDCNYEAVRTLRHYWTKDYFGAGDGGSFAPEDNDGEWRFPESDSVEKILLQAVCHDKSLIPERVMETQQSQTPAITNQIIINTNS